MLLVAPVVLLAAGQHFSMFDWEERESQMSKNGDGQKPFTEDELTIERLSDQTNADTLAQLVFFLASLSQEYDRNDAVVRLGWIMQHGLWYTPEMAEQLSKNLLGVCPRDATPLPYRYNLQGMLTNFRPASPPFGFSGVHGVYLAKKKSDGGLVGLAGLVHGNPQGEMHKLASTEPHWFGFLGGHIVHPEYCRQGIGKLMVRHQFFKIQDYVDRHNLQPATVYATAHISENALSGQGFQYLGRVWAMPAGYRDNVYRKTFEPTAVSVS